MKKKILLSLLAICIGLIGSINILQSHSLTPPVGNTGAPGETTCAQAGCHGGSGTGGVACTDSLIIISKFIGGIQYQGTGTPTNLQYIYVPSSGIVDTLLITLKLPTTPIAGFQMMATSGSFMIVNPSTTQINVSGGKQYISHKNSTNGSNSWTFKWYPTSTTNPQFYFSTVCDTASIAGGSGAGGSCVPGCTGSSSSGGFGATSIGCPNADPQLYPAIDRVINGIAGTMGGAGNSFCSKDTISVHPPNVGIGGQPIYYLTTYLTSSFQYYQTQSSGWSGIIYSCDTQAYVHVWMTYYYKCAANATNLINSTFNNQLDLILFEKPKSPNLQDIFACNNHFDTIGYINPITYPHFLYTWNPTLGLNNSTYSNPVLNSTIGGTYELTIEPYVSVGSPFPLTIYCPLRCITKDTQTIYIHQPTSAITSSTICKNESYLFNGNTYSSAGTFMDTLVNYNGCDSITTLNLTIKTDEPISINGVVCKGGRYIFNGKMYDTSGVFMDTIFSNTSCDTVYTLTLSTAVIPVDTSVSIGNEMLIAHATNSTFQWYDCVNQTLVQGATNDTLLPPHSGYYAAIITTQPELCSDTSACKFIFTTGINSVDELKQTKLFPNPVNDELKIEFSKTIKSGTIKILDLNGAEILNQSFSNKQLIQLSTKNVATGIYVVEVQSSNSVWHQKMMKR